STMVVAHQPLPGDLGPEHLPPHLSPLRGLRDRGALPKNWSSSNGSYQARGRRTMRQWVAMLAIAVTTGVMASAAPQGQGAGGGRATAPGQQKKAAAPAAADAKPSPGAGPVIVFETVKGSFGMETYPNEAPKSVEHILTLARR